MGQSYTNVPSSHLLSTIVAKWSGQLCLFFFYIEKWIFKRKNEWSKRFDFTHKVFVETCEVVDLTWVFSFKVIKQNKKMYRLWSAILVEVRLLRKQRKLRVKKNRQSQSKDNTGTFDWQYFQGCELVAFFSYEIYHIIEGRLMWKYGFRWSGSINILARGCLFLIDIFINSSRQQDGVK